MIVKDLIAKLQKLDLEKEILIQNGDGGSFDIANITSAYFDSASFTTIVEYNDPLSKEDLEDLSKENLRFIVLNKSCYIIKPE